MSELEQTWRGTEIELDHLRSRLVRLHDVGEKNWTPEQRAEIEFVRKRCIAIGEYRYYLLRKK